MIGLNLEHKSWCNQQKKPFRNNGMAWIENTCKD